MNKEEFTDFKKNASTNIGLDFFKYKNSQLTRKFKFLMKKNNINKYSDYLKLLKSDKNAEKELLSSITTNVTEFFRDRILFFHLEQEIIPKLTTKHGTSLKILSAGCSSGEEIYSTALILAEMGILPKCTLIGTDFDPHILEKAKKAEYPIKSVEGKIPEKYKKYFDKSYILKPEVSKKIYFRRHDLLKNLPEKDFHLIICRNLTMYLTEEAVENLHKNIYESLVKGGVLFIGNSEGVGNFEEIGFNRIAPFFYQK